jgi:hypothetical protein
MSAWVIHVGSGLSALEGLCCTRINSRDSIPCNTWDRGPFPVIDMRGVVAALLHDELHASARVRAEDEVVVQGLLRHAQVVEKLHEHPLTPLDWHTRIVTRIEVLVLFQHHLE